MEPPDLGQLFSTTGANGIYSQKSRAAHDHWVFPTVSDRNAQGVVKEYLEPSLEQVFHPSSFGYRPGKSAHDALGQCQDNCQRYAWVIDVDIRGFFDNIPHDRLLRLLEEHTTEKWVLLYVGRWLKAGVQQVDGSIAPREKGTPQGGVISPLLANLYLHHGFDKWMDENHPHNPFERYADDIVIHCRSKAEAEELLQALKARMQDFGLELHPEKTRIVYCKNYQRDEKHEQESFTFLSYDFQPRKKWDGFGRKKTFMIFAGAIATKAKVAIREAIRAILIPRWSQQTLNWFAEKLNPKIRGWINYYGKFYRRQMLEVFFYVNERVKKWIANKYKLSGKYRILAKYQAIQQQQSDLFYHWTLGIRA